MVLVLDILCPDREEETSYISEEKEKPKTYKEDRTKVTRVQVISITGELVEVYI